ncbi:hypothetical protein EIELFIGP_03161 [Stenotrophomonas maltophilia]|nr:hypothetical protein EIELFIGP_03161 [Stenotrophomonas maltophilia]QNG80729.1 hypothetical protein FLFIOBJN_00713 [Stenotrophomonas maltophilia]
MTLLAKPDDVKRRLEICRACPNAERVGRRLFLRCRLCSCPLASKTRFQGASCPAGKW